MGHIILLYFYEFLKKQGKIKSKADLADKMDLSRPYVTSVLNGTIQLSDSFVKQFTGLFEDEFVEFQYFMNGSDKVLFDEKIRPGSHRTGIEEGRSPEVSTSSQKIIDAQIAEKQGADGLKSADNVNKRIVYRVGSSDKIKSDLWDYFQRNIPLSGHDLLDFYTRLNLEKKVSSQDDFARSLGKTKDYFEKLANSNRPLPEKLIKTLSDTYPKEWRLYEDARLPRKDEDQIAKEVSSPYTVDSAARSTQEDVQKAATRTEVESQSTPKSDKQEKVRLWTYANDFLHFGFDRPPVPIPLYLRSDLDSISAFITLGYDLVNQTNWHVYWGNAMSERSQAAFQVTGWSLYDGSSTSIHDSDFLITSPLSKAEVVEFGTLVKERSRKQSWEYPIMVLFYGGKYYFKKLVDFDPQENICFFSDAGKENERMSVDIEKIQAIFVVTELRRGINPEQRFSSELADFLAK